MASRWPPPSDRPLATLFLCGDVMLGRGIDQLFAHPSAPELCEDFVKDARDYVALAEKAFGPIGRPVGPAYVWGAALEELDRASPDARLVNLETSVTTSGRFWPGKGINYRMHPRNVGCLQAARIDACALANNHVLDFDREGLLETLAALKAAGVQAAGAGRWLEEARQPARIPIRGGGRVLFFSMGSRTSGIPPSWAAGLDASGVDLLPDLSVRTARLVAERVSSHKRAGDLAVASVHWGENWGYEVPPEQVWFARALIDGGVDLVHGHSSHHARPLEVYREKLILYGCGDFIDDYEGIRGREEFRPELRLMYFATVEARTGRLRSVRLVPLCARGLSLVPATPEDARWMGETLTAASRRFGAQVVPRPGAELSVELS